MKTATEIANTALRSLSRLDDISDAFRYQFAFFPSLHIGKTVATEDGWRTPVSQKIEFLGADMVNKLTSQLTPSKKVKPEKFNTIGVRFPESPGKEYTYKVRIGAKVHLGQELIADTPRGQAVVFVTRIDKKPVSESFEPFKVNTLKYIERKAVSL